MSATQYINISGNTYTLGKTFGANTSLNAGSTFTMTTGLTVGWSQTEN